jgi:tRNA pseudouridine55 synthase
MGHAGTLDPFAEGVLLICLGRATKRISQLMELKKEYQARISFGIETDTLDVTGRVTERKSVPRLQPRDLQALAARYTGDIEQTPPAYSAVKVNGTRSYRLARKGVSVQPGRRRVRVFKLEFFDIQPPEVSFRVVCSKGTYIRALARDMAHDLGTVAFARTLRRVRIGPYRLSASRELDDRFVADMIWT